MNFIEDNIIEFINIINFINKFSKFIIIIKFNNNNNNFDKIIINYKYIDKYIDLVNSLDCFR